MEPQESKVVVFTKEHAQKIAGFQLKMAKQTQNLDLIYDLVIQAVKYLLDHRQLGFYLAKVYGSTPVGSLLLTFENPGAWWVQSVYVEKDYRRQGHFKSLFNEACRMAKSKGAHSIKLYAESENEKAKETYRSLGMHMNGEKFYTYDFVYGKTKIQDCQKKAQKINLVFKLLEKSEIDKDGNYRDVLVKATASQNKPIQVYKGQQLIAVVFYFTEFSQWRFGLSYYVDSLYILKDLGANEINEIHNGMCVYFSQKSEIKVGALRYIFRENSQKIHQMLQGGQIEHYDVLEINL